MVIHAYLASISLLGIYVVLVALILVASQIGAWSGRRVAKRREKEGDANTLATASLGLLALLIAFTYSISLQRYDLRRQAVLEEANAIGSAANYALMIPEAQRGPALNLLRQYAELRIGLGAPFDPGKFANDIKRTSELQGKLWQQAVAASAAQPQSLPVYQFVSNLNEMNNVGEKRLTALRNHTPDVVVLALVVTAVLSIGFTGFAAGLVGSKRRWGMLLLISLLLAMLILLTIDLDRPDRGSIEVSTQALSDALNAITATPR